MSRTRLISPKFFTNADLYDAEVVSALPLRLTFAGLWSVTDRRGIFRWSRNLKPEVLPYDPCDILACLDALERAGFVRSYEVEGRKYGWIPTFTAHQTFHVRERPSSDPAPPWLASVPSGAAKVSSIESPVPSTAKAVPSPTGTASVTASGTGTGTVELQAAAARGRLKAEIARVANDAIDAVFGTSHKRRPLLPATATAVLEVLDANAIPAEFAISAVAEAVQTLKEPPRSLAYFAPIVLERWDRRLVAESQSPRRQGPVKGQDKRARNMAAIEKGLQIAQGGAVANG